MNESRLTQDTSIVSHVWTSHVSYMNESCLICIDESRLTQDPPYQSHVASPTYSPPCCAVLYAYVTSHTIYERVMSHKHEWAMSHTSAVTRSTANLFSAMLRRIACIRHVSHHVRTSHVPYVSHVPHINMSHVSRIWLIHIHATWLIRERRVIQETWLICQTSHVSCIPTSHVSYIWMSHVSYSTPLQTQVAPPT